MLYILSAIGCAVLWFKPDWRWFAALTAIVPLPGIAYAAFVILGSGASWNVFLPGMLGHLLLALVVFAVPGAAIVALRQWMASHSNDPAPPT